MSKISIKILYVIRHFETSPFMYVFQRLNVSTFSVSYIHILWVSFLIFTFVHCPINTKIGVRYVSAKSTAGRTMYAAI
jgi:hypothetical protein